MKPWMSIKMGFVGSETRSPGQIFQKPSVCHKGQIFNPIPMKFCQDVCLNDISDEFENGSSLETTFSVQYS